MHIRACLRICGVSVSKLSFRSSKPQIVELHVKMSMSAKIKSREDGCSELQYTLFEVAYSEVRQKSYTAQFLDVDNCD